MRSITAIILLLITGALGVCAFVARRSGKANAASVSALVASLTPPVIGNLIIIVSHTQRLSMFGSYVYFLGMDVVMLALLGFTMAYCGLKWPSRGLKWLVYALLAVDAVQLLLNPVFGHAFGLEGVIVDNTIYYRLRPYLGQAFHRVVDYGIFFSVLVIFFVRMVRVPRLYAERYAIIFLSMVLCGLWQTFYIFSRTPVDRSMIGFGVFGLLVFYFALYYRPVLLLNQMLANVASGMAEGLFFLDVYGKCVWMNSLAAERTGVAENDFNGAIERIRATFEGIDLEGGDWSCRWVLGEGEDARYYALTKRGVRDAKDRPVGACLTVRDETAQQRALEKEKYSARHDSLTDLYTKDYLYERVRERIDRNPEDTQVISYLDVNDFKMVNDVFGNEYGDFVLCAIADSLRANLPPECLYGRLGGDTFGLCMPARSFDEAFTEDMLSQFVVHNGSLEHRLVIHQGVYEVTEPELDVSVMFDRAHMALDTIKEEMKKHIAYYDERMREKALWDQYITTQLGDALAEGQLQPYLQALVDGEGRVVGAEALVRWIHPKHGFLSPADFVPVFEKNGMIADMDRYMWRRSCEILARWEREGRGDLFISVNISPKDFYFMDVTAELNAIVAEFGVSPSRLRVEITETVMMADNENRLNILNALKDAGFLVEMDDFGSGYSSLNMLKDMPVDVIKVDMLFLRASGDDRRTRMILQSIMNLTNELGLVPLTEGVETVDQYRMLSDMGCKLFQGYYFAKPMPVEAFEETYMG